LALDWNIFHKLSGDSRTNFEMLCRGIVRLHWGKQGQFQALKNQPGVEFHIKLDTNSTVLGDSSKWLGWQCKKFDSTNSGDLTSTAKAQITGSLDKTVKHLPNLTDWVLWTPCTLSKKDQEWFYDLKYPFKLHLWAEEELDNYLAGPALMLRQSYFGELTLTPDDLESKYTESIALIKDRWLQPIHQITEIERIVRQMLGENEAWQDMVIIGERLQVAINILEEYELVDSKIKDLRQIFLSSCRKTADMLLQFQEVLEAGDMDIINQWFSEKASLIESSTIIFPRLLRSNNLSIALDATNALDDIREAKTLLKEAEDYLKADMVAILADAGSGKTHLSAALTQSNGKRPAGILLHGKHLKNGHNKNNISKRLTINGKSLDSFEQLLTALDSVAKREKCRLPLVIDGLNESENPKDWKDILSEIQEQMKTFPNILIVCTLRTGEHQRFRRQPWREDSLKTRETFAVQALPEGIRKLKSEGFEEDTIDAINKYFDYFKINVSENIRIPFDFLSHPLNLRIFCEVTNPTREESKEIYRLPSSLSHLFDQYISNICTRISAMSHVNYRKEEIQSAIYKLGIMYWEQKTRDISETGYRVIIFDPPDWEKSLVNLFSQEGLIFKNPGDEPHEYVLTPVYDLLGGYIIANALLEKYSKDRNFEWFNRGGVISLFNGNDSHPLSEDILKSLVALVPMRMRSEQLWKNISDDTLKIKALLYTTKLEADYIDAETVESLSNLIKDRPEHQDEMFDVLWLNKSDPTHPLNAGFLNSLLETMTVSERDLTWTEWVRSKKDTLLENIKSIALEWKEYPDILSASDSLRALAIKWFLTTTDHQLRNVVTRVLCRFGSINPKLLFDETLASLKINDPYVPERMLAASYGVSVALGTKFPKNSAFTNGSLSTFASQLFDAMFKEDAPYKTTHEYMRDYASKIIEFTQYQIPSFFTEDDFARTQPPYQSVSWSNWNEATIQSEEFHFKDSPFSMDFENYTIGRLIPGRSNYDYKHEKYKKVRAQILWRIQELGWLYDKFHAVEDRIISQHGYGRGSDEKKKVDRYGKKYSWIAYHEMAGYLRDSGELEDRYNSWRTSTTSVDLSFLPPLQSEELIKESLLGESEIDTESWVLSEQEPDISSYLLNSNLEEEGTWIVLDGYYSKKDKKLDREIFLFVRSFLVSNDQKSQIISYLEKQDMTGRWPPEKHELDNIFWLELPWSNSFQADGSDKLSFPDGEKDALIPIPIIEMDGEARISIGFEEVERKTSTYKEYPVILPVCDLRYEKTDGSPGQITTLTKPLIDYLDLVGQPQSHDLFSRTGEKATLYKEHGVDIYRDSQSFLHIRQELLKKHLDANQLSLIWIVWGEKNYNTFSIVSTYTNDLLAKQALI
jgi:predicted ABC-type transport system involved in lysophospholipase L1 biosynthesis ATPase subunit